MVTCNGAMIIWLFIDLSLHTQFNSKWCKWRCQQIHYLMRFLENIPLVNVFLHFTRIRGIQEVLVKPSVFLEEWWGLLNSRRLALNGILKGAHLDILSWNQYASKYCDIWLWIKIMTSFHFLLCLYGEQEIY